MASAASRFLLPSFPSVDKAAALPRSNGGAPPLPLLPMARRELLFLSTAAPAAFAFQQKPVDARERRNKKAIPEEDYITTSDGQKYYDLVEGKERKREFVDSANGLFSAQAAAKPPAAMYSIAEGMRVGGKRTVIVPPELGYGQKGMNEIPPGATFQLNVELLQLVKPVEN